MTFLSNNQDLIIGDNYTRGMLSDLLNIKYPRDEIERGIYKPKNCSSVLLFFTIQNPWGHYYARISDSEIVTNYSAISVLKEYQKNNELLLFIRDDYESGFDYLGQCQPTEQHKDQRGFPYYGLRLLEVKFSEVKGVNVPEANGISNT
jgi:hypothetical protein